jgi:hypothetical protein
MEREEIFLLLERDSERILIPLANSIILSMILSLSLPLKSDVLCLELLKEMTSLEMSLFQ